jgi:hypothetical protein
MWSCEHLLFAVNIAAQVVIELLHDSLRIENDLIQSVAGRHEAIGGNCTTQQNFKYNIYSFIY